MKIGGYNMQHPYEEFRFPKPYATIKCRTKEELEMELNDYHKEGYRPIYFYTIGGEEFSPIFYAVLSRTAQSQSCL